MHLPRMPLAEPMEADGSFSKSVGFISSNHLVKKKVEIVWEEEEEEPVGRVAQFELRGFRSLHSSNISWICGDDREQFHSRIRFIKNRPLRLFDVCFRVTTEPTNRTKFGKIAIFFLC